MYVAGKAVSMLSGLTKMIKRALFLQSHYIILHYRLKIQAHFVDLSLCVITKSRL